MHTSVPPLVAGLLGLILLSGCASLSGTSPEPSGTEHAQPAKAQPENEPEVEYADFEPEVLYQLLSAEIAAQRGRYDVTLVNYLQAAKTSKDSAVIDRAMRIAQTLNADNAQRQLAALWLEQDPDNLRAHRVSAIQAVKRQDMETALFHMESIMNQGQDADFDSLAALAASLPSAQQQELLQLYRELAERNPDTPDLEYGIALLLKITQSPEEGLRRLNNLLEDHPNFQPAIVLKGDLLYETGQSRDALNYLTTNTRRFPDNRQMGTLFGRMLINEGELQAAQDEFQRLVERFPDVPGLRLSHALVAFENKQPDTARAELERLIAAGHHIDEASYYLGRLEEQAGNTRQAIAYYQDVEQGNFLLPALARAVELQAANGELDTALQELERLRGSNPEQAEQLWLLEVNLLLEQNRPSQAMEAANQALERFPNNVEVLYARGMMYDGLGMTAEAEADLRRILEVQPDNPVALNALGYILTIRTDRLDEAQGYIERALQLDPENPAILDSMGWVLFRQGDIDGALKYLSSAWAAYPDPEVAAHYGEALWVSGNQEQAQVIWEEALDQDPEHEILRETIRRLTGNGDSE
ncbi:MAG TPA: tetratricopeptide repeat protein [Marinobacter sp.]|nr:tetratricopeptide repeat protein [Marinobacter sp.]